MTDQPNTSSDGATRSIPCGYCGAHHGTVCPRIKAIEFHPDGTHKRVEFFAPNDYAPQLGGGLYRPGVIGAALKEIEDGR